MAPKVNQIKDKVAKDFITKKYSLIAETYKPEQFVLFGSRAKGNAKEYSDIDIILVSNEFEKTRFVNRAQDFIYKIKPRDVHIDVLCYTPNEIEKILNGPTFFVKEAIATGIHII